MTICVCIHTYHFNGRGNVPEDKTKDSEEH